MFRFGNLMGRISLVLATLWASSSHVVTGQTDTPAAKAWRFDLRYRTESKAGSGLFHTLSRQENWDPQRTAIIVCDVWDSHHSINAVRRVEELAPRIDQFVKRARDSGATIIHAPSDCMESYVDHPARQRAVALPASDNVPANMRQWCNQIDAEKPFQYPIDQSDGGEDDDRDEHAAWARELAANGRNPGSPWKMQTQLISIDDHHDFISDSGPEIWSLMESRQIDNVILCGVHTNMCVLGRPFGLRNMVTAGKRVVLVRDLTDTMYNPLSWPFVNHHTGTDLIVAYIEKCICPTITSDQLLGGQPFRFQADTRPLLVMLVAEDEYETHQTLPKFAADFLGHHFRVEFVFGNEDNPHDLPGLEMLQSADVALVSIRRRPLPQEQLDIVRQFVASGKPLVGIRTASHAFSLRTEQPPEGLLAWPEFDAQVWGGNYSGHHGNEALPTISLRTAQAAHPVLTGIGPKPFVSGGSLYLTSPLAAQTQILMAGAIAGKPAEPAAWSFERATGGRSFYTSLGHQEDFQQPAFQRLLFNALAWASGVEEAEFVVPKKGNPQ
jgi:nicotinamidase-related amidase/type 1 glutamine amidotransferase